MTLNRFNC